jgi:hypothetical protein
MKRPPPTAHPAFPHVVGVPGGSLGDLSSPDKFGDKAAIGQVGEKQTAQVLDAYCNRDGPTVLHDLVLPMRNITANIDHIVIAGREVTILDTKSWRPGRLWTFRGTTRRGWEKFPPGDKRTLQMANESISALLTQAGVRFKMCQPLMVIWPSNQSKRMSTMWYSPIGATAIRGDALARHVGGQFRPRLADPDIVNALIPLVISVQKNEAARSAPSARNGREPAPPSSRYQSDDF